MVMEPGVGGAGRARAMRAMQGGVGNTRVGRIFDTTAPRVQRQAGAPTAPDQLPPSVTGAIQSGGGQPLDRATCA